ncbi:MAG TPA: DMT family transporter [Flammeovirgaceae bacterium]|nr:DMT family transporter [Flammeovirgaceae bacterium]
MPARYKIHSALLLVGLIYGANYTIAKVVMPAYVGPFGVILIRVVTGSLLYWLFARLAGPEPIRYKRDYLRLAGLAVFGVALNQLMFFKGLSMTSPISAAVIMTSSPITVLVVSYFLLHEKITARKVAGILLGATGAILLIGIDGYDFSNTTFLGNLFILINATSYSLYLVLVKPLMMRYRPFTIIKWVFLFGTVYVLPFGIGEFSQVNWSAMPAHAWYALAYVVVATTFIAYLLNVWSLQYVNPTLVGYYIYLQPLFATLVAVVFRGDALTVQEALYAALIFAGVYLVSAGR